ncbi:MAG: DegT/DnrJ/EryC1/StrS family aminotransferase [Phycisphaerae bacterium]|nr:DegT/DnrJ/EryC1/StrS family aminotransferase [Phycisphaerae bacterium]
MPSAGPWITAKEVRYVQDAVAHGWYQNWSGYLDRFEAAFAKWIGVRFALSTSSCTGALHIAARALDLKPGDEVIAPEATWIATVTSFCHLGARPVFVDVDPETWCLDPRAFERAITPRTKAVIPVDLYGTPSDKDAILRIAAEHGLAVIEDAAPGIGSRYHGRLCGSFGLAGVFSFQGAKPLATGEGGMLVTNDENFYDRCYYYWDHCRDKSEVLYNTDLGFKYKMSNVQAALGLAQLERVDEIIAKRRQIFFWYRERLGGIPGLRMNVEPEGCFCNYYVPTIILEGSFPLAARTLGQRLDAAGIRNRPFFRPLSKLPMFAPVTTPVADRLAETGLNLPCATLLTEDDVDYVSRFVRRELTGQS